MATRTNRTDPVRTTNNKTAAAVRTAITALKQVSRRADALDKGLDKVYAEQESIGFTVDALAQKIHDGTITSSALIDALNKIQERIFEANNRLSVEQTNLETLSADADWIADGLKS
jgi:chromosome segregation ATPase